MKRSLLRNPTLNKQI